MKKYLIFMLIGILILVGIFFIYSDFSNKRKIDVVCNSYLDQTESMKNQFYQLINEKSCNLLDIIKNAKENQIKIDEMKVDIQNIRSPKVFKTDISDKTLKQLNDIQDMFKIYTNLYSQIKTIYKESVDIEKEIEEMRGIYATEELVSMESLLKELKSKKEKSKKDEELIKDLEYKIENANKKKKMNYSMIDKSFSELNDKNEKLILTLQSINVPEEIEKFIDSLLNYFKERKNYLLSYKEVYSISKEISDKYDEALQNTIEFYTHLENSNRYADLLMFSKAFEELDKAKELNNQFTSILDKIDELETTRDKIHSDAEKHYLNYKKEENKTFNVNMIIILKKNVKDVVLNGSTITLDTPPLEVDNRIFVPIKFIIEILGGKISWDVKENKTTIEFENNTIEMWFDLDKKTAKVNGEPYLMDVAPFTKFDRGYVPIRFVAEVLGCDVIWDSEKEEVIIISTKLDWKIFDI